MSKYKILGRKILFVTAHPDDESFLCAGAMVENHKSGGKNILICATDGEAGRAHLEKPVSKKALARIRRGELEKVSRILKVSRLYALGLPDGQVHTHTKQLWKVVSELARREQPELLAGFGPDGVTGHRDHIAAGQIAKKVADQLEIGYCEFALCPSVARNAMEWLVKRRSAPHYRHPKKIRHIIANVKIPIDREVKLRALACHCSQLDGDSPFGHYPDNAVKELLSADYFRIKK